MEKYSKKVAVIIPIYNVERYLKECIDSVINQTYKNIEIILVNDGSTDNSLGICLDYFNKDERIHIINKKNKGLSSARNAGLDYIYDKEIKDLYFLKHHHVIKDVEYIHFLDSDDYMLSNCIEFCIKKINDNDILWHGFFILNCFSLSQYRIIEEGELVLNFDEVINLRKIIDGSWCFLIRCDKFKDVRFIEGIINENVYYGTKICSMSDKIKIINKLLLVYRIRYDSITNPVTEKPYHKFITNSISNLTEADFYLNIYSNLKTFIELEKILENKYMQNYYIYLLKDKIIDKDPFFLNDKLDFIHKKYSTTHNENILMRKITIGEDLYE